MADGSGSDRLDVWRRTLLIHTVHATTLTENICTLLDDATMTDDLIDCTGFEDLGVPTPLECWRQQAHLLACEVGDLQKDLSVARRNIHKLVGMHTAVAKERDALALEVIELKWRVSDMLREQGMAAAAKINPFENCHRHSSEVGDQMSRKE